jgi:hypothetical protein
MLYFECFAQKTVQIKQSAEEEVVEPSAPMPSIDAELNSSAPVQANSDIPDIVLPINIDPLFKAINLEFHNDKPFKTDQDFTTELSIQAITKLWEVPLPLIGFDRKTGYTLRPGTISETRNFQKITTAIGYYTPKGSRLSDSLVLHDTRPYASLQHLEIGRISERLIYDYEAAKYYYTQLTSALTVGLTGGQAAQNLQYWFHKKIATKSVIPEGWHNQIGGLSNQLVVNYLVGYQYLLTNSRIKETFPCRWNNQTSPIRITSTFQLINVLNGIKVNVGSWRNDVTANFRVNLFNINTASQYFSGFDNGNYVGYPGGMSHGRRNKVITNPNSLMDRQYPINYGLLQYPVKNIPDKKIVFSNGENDITHTILGVVDTLNNRNSLQENLKSVQPTAEVNKPASPEMRGVSPSTDTPTLPESKREIRLYGRPFSFQLFANFEGKFVAHDGSLQGVLFYRRNTNPTYLRLIHPLQLMTTLGVYMRWGAVTITGGVIMRTREYYTHQSDPRIDPANPTAPPRRFTVNTIDDRKLHSWAFIRFDYLPSYAFEQNRYKKVARKR